MYIVQGWIHHGVFMANAPHPIFPGPNPFSWSDNVLDGYISEQLLFNENPLKSSIYFIKTTRKTITQHLLRIRRLYNELSLSALDKHFKFFFCLLQWH